MSTAMQIFSGSLDLISIFFLWKNYFYSILLIAYLYCQGWLNKKQKNKLLEKINCSGVFVVKFEQIW